MFQMNRPVQLRGISTLISLCVVATAFNLSAAEEPALFRKLRQRMVRQVIAPEGITNEAVLSAVRTVPRHLFVRKSQQKLAYFDQALPIGYKQTISPPFVVSYMTQMIDPQPTDKVLEIGTGSGYQAAVLSEIVDHVYTIEIVEQLGKSAAKRLKLLGYDNVTPKVGDGYQGWKEHAPFDKIIVTCSPEDVPQALVDQLREGGKMIVPLGRRYQQVFYLFEKQDDKLVKQQLIPTLFVPMTGKAEDARKIKPDPTKPRIFNGSFELDENEDDRTDSWHYQRQNELVSGGAPDGKVFMQFTNRSPGRGAQLLQGFAIDGESVRVLDVRLRVRVENGRQGKRLYEKPALYVHFYDNARRAIGEKSVGPWLGSFGWKRVQKQIKVPTHAKEAVIRIGLNGATGILSVDDIKISTP